MSRATTAATTRPEESTVNTTPDLAKHPAVRAVRADIAAAVERHATLPAGTPGAGPERVGRALAQAALVAEAERLEQDADLTEPERRRALAQLGKLNTTAPDQVEELAVRAEEIAAEPGRVRRYCSPPCRTRARRAAANR